MFAEAVASEIGRQVVVHASDEINKLIPTNELRRAVAVAFAGIPKVAIDAIVEVEIALVQGHLRIYLYNQYAEMFRELAPIAIAYIAGDDAKALARYLKLDAEEEAKLHQALNKKRDQIVDRLLR